MAIPKGAYLGAYTGEFITEDEDRRRYNADRWQDMMGLLDCAKPHTGGIAIIDGITGNAFTRMNYAPAEFRNVKFEKICEAPFVKIMALRDIAAGEELWVDYGPNYRYDFMNDPAVAKFFADLRAQPAKEVVPAGSRSSTRSAGGALRRPCRVSRFSVARRPIRSARTRARSPPASVAAGPCCRPDSPASCRRRRRSAG